MKWYRKITIEIAVILVTSGFLLMGGLRTNLLIYRTCYITLGFNESDCVLLGAVSTPELQELEKKVQPTANIFIMIHGLMLNHIPVLVSLIVGAWSDKYGRKPAQLFVLTGIIIHFTLASVYVCFKNLSPWYLLLSIFPLMISGSLPTYLTVVLTYINDISTDESRAMRMVLYEAIIGLCYVATYFSGFHLFYATNYETVFFFSTGLIILGTLYTKFYIPESNVTRSKQNKISGFWKCAFIVDLVKVLLKSRGGWNKCILILLILAYCINISTVLSSSVITFQFLRKALGWTLEKYNYFEGIATIICISGSICGTLFLKNVLKIQESIIILLCLLSYMASSLLWGLATNDYYIYAASIFAVLTELTAPMLRSRLGQIIPRDEMGKIFSLAFTISGLTNVLFTYFYTMVYNSTLNFHAGTYNFITTLFYFITFIIICIVVFLEKSSDKKRSPSQKEKIKNECSDHTQEELLLQPINPTT